MLSMAGILDRIVELCVCTGIFDDIAECVANVTHSHGFRCWLEKGGEQGREETPGGRKHPLFALRSHFIFLTRNNTQSNGLPFPTLLCFPYFMAGKRKGFIEAPPPWILGHERALENYYMLPPFVPHTHTCLSVYTLAQHECVLFGAEKS